jgi:hypothetical protein
VILTVTRSSILTDSAPVAQRAGVHSKLDVCLRNKGGGPRGESTHCVLRNYPNAKACFRPLSERGDFGDFQSSCGTSID